MSLTLGTVHTKVFGLSSLLFIQHLENPPVILRMTSPFIKGVNWPTPHTLKQICRQLPSSDRIVSM